MTTKWAIAACSVVAGLVVMEGLARMVPEPADPPSSRRYINSDPSLPTLTSYFQLGTPFQHGLLDGVLYETNALGLRSPEIARAKPPDVSRAALLGDSFVMGAGVLAEESYAGILQRELPNVRPGRYEVVNTGLAGSDAIHAFKRYQRLGLPYDPDLAIYGFTLNDIEGPSYRKSLVTLLDPYGIRASPSALWRRAGPGYVALREAFWPARGTYAYELRDNYFRNDVAWSHLVEAFNLLASVNERRGMCTVLLIHTQLVTLNGLYPFRRIHERVAALAREKGFFVIDSLSAHLGEWDLSLWVSPVDWHPNAKGHRILADALLAGLKSLPQSCWKRQLTEASPSP